MNASAWVPLLVSAITTALHEGKRFGLPTPTAEELLKAANEAAAQILPAAIVGATVLVEVTAAHLTAEIDSLGQVERCTKCGSVLTIHASSAGRSTSCDNCDGILR